eukprot:gnl/TRDRNA2_/TRDRNA2_182748_c0_seq1.p1 gnl/TRDRNA2_/TRDRNA2_182748_c0~~gnl/TRDRNA2_/TRDRNA2_182748_c0_seq1.p1  ORF type:complete len:401 (-),score=49.46 gnl/TRDRNA2_/TRDRNA2_182748_c0_seq1:86-1288(-)
MGRNTGALLWLAATEPGGMLSGSGERGGERRARPLLLLMPEQQRQTRKARRATSRRSASTGAYAAGRRASDAAAALPVQPWVTRKGRACGASAAALRRGNRSPPDQGSASGLHRQRPASAKRADAGHRGHNGTADRGTDALNTDRGYPVTPHGGQARPQGSSRREEADEDIWAPKPPAGWMSPPGPETSCWSPIWSEDEDVSCQPSELETGLPSQIPHMQELSATAVSFAVSEHQKQQQLLEHRYGSPSEIVWFCDPGGLGDCVSEDTMPPDDMQSAVRSSGDSSWSITRDQPAWRANHLGLASTELPVLAGAADDAATATLRPRSAPAGSRSHAEAEAPQENVEWAAALLEDWKSGPSQRMGRELIQRGVTSPHMLTPFRCPPAVGKRVIADLGWNVLR